MSIPSSVLKLKDFLVFRRLFSMNWANSSIIGTSGGGGSDAAGEGGISLPINILTICFKSYLYGSYLLTMTTGVAVAPAPF